MNSDIMDQDPAFSSDPSVRPQPEYRINLTLAVSDAQALWTAAAARLLCAAGMRLEDVLDVIGPREDPSIVDCIATLARPDPVAGCTFDDFWIDGLLGCPSRSSDAPPAAYEVHADAAARRAAPRRRVAPVLRLAAGSAKPGPASPGPVLVN